MKRLPSASLILLSSILNFSQTYSPAQMFQASDPFAEIRALEDRLFVRLNQMRAAVGSPVLPPSTRLQLIAKNHSRMMALARSLLTLKLRSGPFPDEESSAVFWNRARAAVLISESLQQAELTLIGWILSPEGSWTLSVDFNRAALGLAVGIDDRAYMTVAMVREAPPEENLASLELKLLTAVNLIRSMRGLPELKLSETLRRIARAHSQSMALSDQISHIGPNPALVRAYLSGAGVTGWRVYAENVAKNKGHIDPVRSAVEGWLSSPGHAANILNPDFSLSGVGIARSLDGTYYFTQIFIR